MSYIYVLVIILMFSTIVNAVEIMTLDDIKTGMKGFAKTVFHGYEVEEFPIEILDIVEDQGLNTDLILFKASGEQIEKAGGIAAGMSGSPVYINGKLIGAIGYGWPLSNHRYGLITPIEEMLKLFETTPEKNQGKSPSINLKTPLFISGMRGRAFNRMKDSFEGFGFEVMQGGGSSSVKSNGHSLEPGSAIAVQLVRGDINVASIGTLTYQDNERILAFGHPFNNKGNVEYLLSRAYINGIIPGLETPFKLGSVTDELLGLIEVDRGAGIAGRLNKYPKIIPLRVKVNDKDRNKTNVVNVQIVKDEDLLTSLITNVSLQSLDATLDRIGKGTARVNYKITGKGLPDLGVERNNVFYSRNDIAAVSLYEIYNIIDIITSNPFKKVELIDVKLDIEVENIDNVALIQEAKVLNESIKPGDRLEVEVTIRPYRQEPFVKTVFIDLPEDMNPGYASLMIDGGLTGESYQTIPEEGMEQEESNQAIIGGYKDLESILEDFLERPKNNELILQVYPGYPMATVGNQSTNSEADVDSNLEENIQDENNTADLEKNNNETDKENLLDDELIEEDEEIKQLYPTEYVLEGSLSLDINVEEKDGAEKDGAEIVQENKPAAE